MKRAWINVGVIIELPFCRGRSYCLSILFRLHLNEKSAAKHRRSYRTRPELAVEMLELLCQHRQCQRSHLIADSAYGGQSVLCCLPTNCELTSRLVKDARLYVARPGRTSKLSLPSLKSWRAGEWFSDSPTDIRESQPQGW